MNGVLKTVAWAFFTNVLGPFCTCAPPAPSKGQKYDPTKTHIFHMRCTSDIPWSNRKRLPNDKSRNLPPPGQRIDRHTPTAFLQQTSATSEFWFRPGSWAEWPQAGCMHSLARGRFIVVVVSIKVDGFVSLFYF